MMNIFLNTKYYWINVLILFVFFYWDFFLIQSVCNYHLSLLSIIQVRYILIFMDVTFFEPLKMKFRLLSILTSRLFNFCYSIHYRISNFQFTMVRGMRSPLYLVPELLYNNAFDGLGISTLPDPRSYIYYKLCRRSYSRNAMKPKKIYWDEGLYI